MKHELSTETKRRMLLGMLDAPKNGNRRKREIDTGFEIATFCVASAIFAGTVIVMWLINHI